MNARVLALLGLLSTAPILATPPSGTAADAQDRLGIDVSGSALVHAASSGIGLSVDNSGARARLDVDLGTLSSTFHDNHRLDLRVSGPLALDDDAADDSNNPFAGAFLATLGYSRIIWDPPMSQQIHNAGIYVCNQFKDAVGLDGEDRKAPCRRELFSDPALTKRLRPDNTGAETPRARQQQLGRQWRDAYIAATGLEGTCLRRSAIDRPRLVDPETGRRSAHPNLGPDDFVSCGKPPPLSVIRVSAAAGTQDLRRVSSEGDTVRRETEVPWSFGVDYGIIIGRSLTLALGGAYRQTVTSGEPAEVCRTDPDTAVVTCQPVDFEAGPADETGVARMQIGYRPGGGSLAIQLIASYEEQSGTTRVSLPLLFGAAPGSTLFNGGLALTWDSDSEEPRLQLIAGREFSMQGLLPHQ